jgi:tRNA A-37 threonylcarbamoyl transferase component Bud32
VDPALQRYALTDPLFYDDPARRPRPAARPFAPDPELDWSGWRRTADGHWTGWHPAGRVLPEQGWKIHLSSTAAEAAGVLRHVSAYCHAHALAFKHLPDGAELFARNAKEADRAGAGKFVTVYPADEAELHRTLLGLDALVGGTPGPYILSDLRWGAGPLHVRYGSFVRRWTRDAQGTPVLALRAPDGRLVEDRRTTELVVPDWVTLPDFLQRQVDALGDGEQPAALPYAITGPLHYSAAGGLYAATDADGRRVVLKEARPHAGWTADGRDATTRLTDEETALRAVAGPDVVAVRDAVTVQGHRFLVLEHVPGASLGREVVARCPAVRDGAGPADHLEYRQWALDVAAQVTRSVDRLHAAGWVHGDLHPHNVIVTPQGRTVLLDLEMAHRTDDPRPMLTGAPGFVAPDGRTGVAADRYALACLRIFLFCPLTPLLALDPLKADELLEHARDVYALDDAWVDQVRADLALPGRERLVAASPLVRAADATLRDWDTGSEDAVLGLQVMLARSLDAAADPARPDRVWPGDPRQTTENGWALAHGAAGVVHALETSSLDVDPQAHQWLAATAPGGRDVAGDRDVAGVAGDRRPGSAEHLGLFDGIAGLAWLRRRQGHHAEADRLVDRLRGADLDRLGPDLYGGLPGVGLLLLAESASDPALVETADRIAALLRTHHDARPHLDPGDPAPTVRTGAGGLMHGATGTALFATRLYARTGEAAHLRLATDALDHDLARCTLAPDGSLQVNEGWRLMPYLATGSAGIGLATVGLLRHLPDPERHLLALDGIAAAARAPFVIEPGLFDGRAGLIHLLVVLTRFGLATPASERALAAHVSALRLHAVRHRTGIAFPGRGLLRLSCDLATGSAGVLTALQAWTMLAHDEARDGWDQLLPFLLPALTPAVPPAHDPDTLGRR